MPLFHSESLFDAETLKNLERCAPPAGALVSIGFAKFLGGTGGYLRLVAICPPDWPHGATVSALLPGLASCFNHSCEPNVLISCGETARVAFVTGAEDVPAGHELCISYCDVELDRKERRELLLRNHPSRSSKSKMMIGP